MWTPVNGKQWMCNTMLCCGKILNLKTKPISLQEVKELIGEIDVEKKAHNWSTRQTTRSTDYWRSMVSTYVEAYTQALEDNKEKKYTEEDVGKIFYVGVQLGINQELYAQLGKPLQNEEEVLDRTIKSLQPKTEWEVKFINGKLTLKQ
jgi:DNA-directed RNA polymerase subunit F